MINFLIERFKRPFTINQFGVSLYLNHSNLDLFFVSVVNTSFLFGILERNSGLSIEYRDVSLIIKQIEYGKSRN